MTECRLLFVDDVRVFLNQLEVNRDRDINHTLKN